MFETKPTLSPTAAERFAHCPAAARQAVEQVERGKQQHNLAQNRIASAFGIARKTAECRLDSDDIADATWAADEALSALNEEFAEDVHVEHKLNATAKADVIADIHDGPEDGILVVELKFTDGDRKATDPQMLMTAAAAWKARTAKPDFLRILVINGKTHTVAPETITAPAMDWITDHLVASWLADACAESSIEVCPTWCLGCTRRRKCTAYQSLRNQIVKDEIETVRGDIYDIVREAVTTVTAEELMNENEKPEPVIIHEDTIDDVEERELAEMGHPVHRVWRDGVSY